MLPCFNGNTNRAYHHPDLEPTATRATLQNLTYARHSGSSLQRKTIGRQQQNSRASFQKEHPIGREIQMFAKPSLDTHLAPMDSENGSTACSWVRNGAILHQ